MKNAVPELKGIALFDSDGQNKTDAIEVKTDFALSFWKRYELENYFVTPNTLFKYIETTVKDEKIVAQYAAIWQQFVLEKLFNKRQQAFESYRKLDKSLQEFQFETLLTNKKASAFLEDYFQTVSKQTITGIFDACKERLPKERTAAIFTISLSKPK